MEILVTGDTIPEVYHRALFELHASGRDEVGMTMEIRRPFAEPMISRCFPGGAYDLQKYVMELRDGINDFEVDAGKWHYTYHGRFAEWLPDVEEMLKRDPDTRRACISIRSNAADMDSTDPACLQTLHFMIRNGKLDLHTHFRSNDGVRAAFMNIFGLVMLQDRVANAVGVPVGEYIHRADSFHVYPESRKTLEGYVKRIVQNQRDHKRAKFPVTYHYKDEFEPQMLACVDDIWKQSREQYAKFRSELAKEAEYERENRIGTGS